jgi:hypothetical protein
MNNFAIDNNIFIFRPSNQKIQPIFHYNSFDLESNIENYDSGFEKRFLFNLYKLNHEKDLYGAKIMQETNQKKLDIIDEINHSSNAITNNVNNNFFLFEDLIPFYNMENDNYFSKNKDIFKIVKINKKIGRIKKNSTVKRIHNKLSQDNIIRKIKGRFHEKLRLYNNEEYKKYLFKKTGKKKKLINWMKRISPKVSRRIKKEDNLKWFESKIFEIFSEKVSLKYSVNNFDLNKKKINKLIVLNEAKNVINILNTNVEELYEKYINNVKIDGFKTLKDDMEELEVHMESTNQENVKEYLQKYEYIAKNLKSIFLQKIARNHKKKKANVQSNNLNNI